MTGRITKPPSFDEGTLPGITRLPPGHPPGIPAATPIEVLPGPPPPQKASSAGKQDPPAPAASLAVVPTVPPSTSYASAESTSDASTVVSRRDAFILALISLLLPTINVIVRHYF